MTSLVAENPTPKPAFVSRALVRLCNRSLQQPWGLRLGRLYAFGIGVSYALVALVGPETLAVSSKLWVRCLGTASWVAGVGALSLATDLAARDAAQGITGLARLRGFGESELERARQVAGAIKLGTIVLVPGLLLSLASAARFRSLPAALLALSLGVLTIPYAALVGAVLALLARACQRVLPGRGRLLLLLVGLGPWLLAAGLGVKVPSLPAGFSWMLEHLARSFH